jgi:hypothetical protein
VFTGFRNQAAFHLDVVICFMRRQAYGNYLHWFECIAFSTQTVKFSLLRLMGFGFWTSISGQANRIWLMETMPHYPFFFNVISGFRGAGGLNFPKTTLVGAARCPDALQF